MAYFPMFVDITDKDCLIVGGGLVAYRKINTLLDFGAEVTVVATDIDNKIKQIAKDNTKVKLRMRKFCDDDIAGKLLVIAATDDKELNHRISSLCVFNKIPVNSVDDIENCSFILPSIIREKDVVAAFSSSGKAPVITQYLKEKESGILTPLIGEINDCMGEYRGIVKERIDDENLRKQIYNEILELSIKERRVLSESEIMIIIERIEGEIDAH